ncbi:MAG: NAD(P)/FAD-dependent oxidoreductase [Candidatus Komeilibacteria bacterium]|jgi:predicted Rossmann fold flavoprotein|nr:NAD(P)/FAD-dependent oxidoreductase [Candidatus Komeilibacteria bacterium]MBT4447143.1 NAD(P)/FAD-dependent oxidoreductase [Candidatus Komeilibacteria bacterium]
MIYDLIVIGGGPAGMMAAGRAAERGANVLLLEKNDRLGIKLVITGKGRCNITNAEINTKNLVDIFGKPGRFLFSALNNFGNQDIINFFESRGLATKVERGNRVFPVSDSSLDVLDILKNYLAKYKVKIKYKINIKSIITKAGLIEKIVLADKSELQAKKYLIATGGKSYPMTGSSGDAHKWLEKMGHTIIDTNPALTPLLIKEKLIKELEGLSLKNVTIDIYQANKKIDSRFGEALFTGNGMSGPIILDMSKQIGLALKQGDVKLSIDYKPKLDFKTLDQRLQDDFSKSNNKLFRNSLGDLLPKKLIPLIIKLSEIDPEQKANAITKLERKKLLHLLKNFELNVKSLYGYNKAIVTAGGVSLKEVDPKTMQSKKIKNLYLAGEILDLDAPTGGYNLQSCWSTGYTAGENI